MNRRLTIITALVALGAAPCPAHADAQFTDTPAPASWTDLLGSAAAVWDGRYPACPGGVQVHIMHEDGPVAARAQQPGCRMWINAAQITADPPAAVKCKVLAHEWGHLLGNPHTPGGVMDATTLMYAAPMSPCEALAAGGTPLPLPAPPPPPAEQTPSAPPVAPIAEALHAPPPALTVRRARKVAIEAMGRRWKLTGCGRLDRHIIACSFDERSRGRRMRLLTIRTRPAGSSLHLHLQTFAAEPGRRAKRRGRAAR